MRVSEKVHSYSLMYIYKYKYDYKPQRSYIRMNYLLMKREILQECKDCKVVPVKRNCNRMIVVDMKWELSKSLKYTYKDD